MKKAGYFFYSFLPLFASIGLQFAAAFPITGFFLLHLFLSDIFTGNKSDGADLLSRISAALTGQTFTTAISIMFAALGIFIFGFWYSCQSDDLSQKSVFFANRKLLLGLVLLIPALQILSALITAASAAAFPGSMAFYERLMETAGLSSTPSPLLLLYAVLLGPIEEELTFRGVIFFSAKKALPFWAANIFQALLFGIFHMNLIQGIYAFFVGLFLGYVCGKTGSIRFSIFVHILYNLWGTLNPLNDLLLDRPLFYLIFLALSAIAGIAGLMLFWRNCRNQDSHRQIFYT